jgi:protein-disulfide isomerase
MKRNFPTYLLAFCAVIVIALVLRKYFFAQSHQSPAPEPLEYIETDTLSIGGIQTGAKNPKVTIIKFYDYECPFCKKFQKSVDYVKNKFESQIQVQYAHFPLNNHQNAMEAAFVAECAQRQNRFKDTHSYLFQNQSVLDTLKWEEVFQDIGITEKQEFLNCIEYQKPFKSIEQGIAAAEELDIQSIPTFIINGKMYSGALSPQMLQTLVQKELD